MAINHKGWIRGVVFIVPFIFFLGIFMVMGALIAGSPFMEPAVEETPYQEFVISFFQLAGTFLVVWIFVAKVDNIPLADVGFQIKDKWGHLLWGIILGLLILGLGFIVLWLSECIIIKEINFLPEDLFYILWVFVVVAITEEVVFRGYILRNFLLSFNKYVALVLSSIIFALMHMGNSDIDWVPLLNLFLLGVIFGSYYIFTQNLWFPIGFHFSWNFFQAFLGFNISGNRGYSPVEFEAFGNSLWHGGPFGFEGSLLAVVGQIFLILILFLYFLPKEKGKI